MTLTLESVGKVLIRAQQAGLMYGVAGDDLTERIAVWATALNRESVTEAEATEAIVELSRRHGEDRIIRLQPGHVMEAVSDLRKRERREHRLLPTVCGGCENGWVYFQGADGYSRVRPCELCRPAQAAALGGAR